jgi:hypothetical protein
MGAFHGQFGNERALPHIGHFDVVDVGVEALDERCQQVVG